VDIKQAITAIIP